MPIDLEPIIERAFAKALHRVIKSRTFNAFAKLDWLGSALEERLRMKIDGLFAKTASALQEMATPKVNSELFK